MGRVRYSGAAKSDLEQIGDYIMLELNSPKAALDTVRKIQNSIDRLGTFPQIGSPLSSIVNSITDYCCKRYGYCSSEFSTSLQRSHPLLCNL